MKYDDFRVVVIALKAHARLPGHQTEGRISIQSVAGHIQGARKVVRSTFPWAVSSPSIGGCRTTSKLLKERVSPDDRLAWQRPETDLITLGGVKTNTTAAVT